MLHRGVMDDAGPRSPSTTRIGERANERRPQGPC